MAIVKFTINHMPVAKDRPRFARIGKFVTTYSSKNTKQGELELNLLASKYKLETPIKGAIAVSLIFHISRPKSIKKSQIYPITRPDIDNYIKLALDAFSAGNLFWYNDSQVTKIISERRYTDENPRIDVEIEEIC
jgi:Holliday junction resolvase RusA-like endonuclease